MLSCPPTEHECPKTFCPNPFPFLKSVLSTEGEEEEHKSIKQNKEERWGGVRGGDEW